MLPYYRMIDDPSEMVSLSLYWRFGLHATDTALRGAVCVRRAPRTASAAVECRVTAGRRDCIIAVVSHLFEVAEKPRLSTSAGNSTEQCGTGVEVVICGWGWGVCAQIRLRRGVVSK